jgi:hypothetical protein
MVLGAKEQEWINPAAGKAQIVVKRLSRPGTKPNAHTTDIRLPSRAINRPR